MQLLTRAIDVGHPTKTIVPVQIRFVVGMPPSPSDQIIRANSPKRGTFGFIDPMSPRYPAYLSKTQAAIKAAIAANALVVLPEFAGAPDLEYWLSKELKKTRYNCVVVGGTYYRRDDSGRIESVCPIVLGDGRVYHQLKFAPSPAEERHGCDELAAGMVYIFRNTGFGDFAVIVCSDALRERSQEVVAEIRGRIDLLVVIARNRGDTLPNALKDCARNEGWVVAYCNGKERNSTIFTPSRMKPNIGKQDGGSVDIRDLQRELAETPDRWRKPGRAGFKPRPRHWPASMGSPIEFGQYSKVLAVGSHFDDIWLGCSATLMLLQEVYGAQIVCTSLCTQYPHRYFDYYDLSSRQNEMHSFLEHLCNGLGFKWVEIEAKEDEHLADRGFSRNMSGLKQRVERLWETYGDVDLLFIPRGDDLHDDHVLTARAMLAQFRQATILQYEVKEFRRAPFQPTVIVDVSARSQSTVRLDGRKVFFASGEGSFAEKKAKILKDAFKQFFGGELPRTFEVDHTLGRMTVRAAESSGEVRYAEGFATEILMA